MNLRGMGLPVVLALVAWAVPAAPPAHGLTVTVDETTTYQTVDGWGACAGMETLVTDARARDAYKYLGCNLLRVAVEPCLLMDPGGDLYGPFVELTADLAANAAKVDWEHNRTDHWDNVAGWLAANALEPDRVRVHLSCWSPPNWSKAPTGAAVNGTLTPFIMYCNECDSVGGTWDDGAWGWNAYQYCARYLGAVCRAFELNSGVTVDALGIQNEVAFEQPFNSCTLYHQARAEKIEQPTIMDYSVYANALKAVKDEFGLYPELSDILVLGPHNANVQQNPGNPWGLLWQMGGIQAVKDHSDPALLDYLAIYTHNYSADAPKRAEMFRAYWEGMDSMPDEQWAAWEYPACMYSGIVGDGKPTWNSEFGGHDPSFTGAMSLANDAHSQLVWGNESAIIHWAFVESSHSVHNLLGTAHLDDPHQSKKYCAFKHFSRYIRPGAQRVRATFDENGWTCYGTADDMDDEQSINVSAYVHQEDGTVTVVLVNVRTDSYTVDVNVPSSPAVNTYSVFRTSSTESFAQLADVNVSGGQVSVSVPGESIVTLTGVAPPETDPPAPPTNLTATAIDSHQIDLDWDDNTEPDLDGYSVYRDTTSGGPYAQIDSGVPTSSYSDTGLAGGTTYYYVVTAVDVNANESAASNEASATTPTDSTPPAPPTNLSATVVSPSQVDLDWDDNTEPDLDGYSVYRGTTSGGPYGQIASDVPTSDYSDTAVTPDVTYYYVVTAVDTAANESGYSNEASATPTDPPPAAPTNLTAAAGDTVVNLDWDDNSEPDLDSYSVYRDTTSGGPYSQIDTGVATSNYTDTGLTNGTAYYYVVTAVDAGANESGYSNEASATPTASGPPGELLTWDFVGEGGASSSTADSFGGNISTAPPSGVASVGPGLEALDYCADGLTARASQAMTLAEALAADDYFAWSIAPMPGHAMTLEWVEIRPVSQNRTRTFVVFSSVDGFAEGSEVGSFTASCNVGCTLRTVGLAGHDNLTAEVEFRMYVYGYDNFYESVGMGNGDGYDLMAYGSTTAGGDTTPPAPPTNLSATAGDGIVDLDWDDNPEPDLASYSVYRDTSSGGPYSQIDSGIATSDYSDSTVTNGTTYYYVVTAVDTSSNESGYSDEASATPQDTTAPAPPANLSATSGDGVVDLDWDDNSEPDLASYSVYRDTSSGGPYSQIDSGIATSDYSDSTVTNGTTYYYVVTAVDTSSNESGYSNEASATPQGDVTPPAAPTNLSATAGDGVVDLDWDDNSEPDLASYSVYRDTSSGGPYGQIASGVAASDYSDSSVTNGTTYYYVVTAVDASSNESGYSNEASATAQDTTAPAAPTNLSATAGDGVVDLDWDDNSEPDLASYSVYRDTSSGGPYGQIASGVVASDYSDSSVTNGTTYYYVVTAVDAASNESGYSNEASATPQASGTTMHIDSIVVEWIAAGGPNRKGQATVVVKDNLGNTVADATVTGTFTGTLSEAQSGTTDGTGTAVIQTKGKTRNPGVLTFCVDGVTHATLDYAPGDNLETCDST